MKSQQQAQAQREEVCSILIVNYTSLQTWITSSPSEYPTCKQNNDCKGRKKQTFDLDVSAHNDIKRHKRLSSVIDVPASVQRGRLDDDARKTLLRGVS